MSAERETAVHVIVKGRVQGVGFRYFTQDQARAYGLKGWVRNSPNGDVEAEAEGVFTLVEKWLDQLRKGPSMARVEAVDVTWRPFTGQHADFQIR